MLSTLMEGTYSLDVNNLILFSLLMVFFLWSRRALAYVTIDFSQKVFWKLRMMVLQTILKANYEEFNSKKDQIYSVLTHDISVLTGASLAIIQFVSSAVVVICCFIYMGILSWQLCLITLATAVFGVLIYHLGSSRHIKRFGKARDLENSFMHHFLSIIDGFKEIKINPLKGQEIFRRKIKQVADESVNNNVKAFTGFLNNQITGQIFFFCLIAYILTIHMAIADDPTTNVINFVFILLFILGSIETIMVLLPEIAQARISFARVRELHTELIHEDYPESNFKSFEKNKDFKNILVRDLTFAYQKTEGEESFGIGPIDLTIEKGKTVFISGGNGSGKTTFMNVFLGLLKRQEGDVIFDDKLLEDSTEEEYRSLFSVVFNDFYLFDEFYGTEKVDVEALAGYIKLFEMEEKVSFSENGFSTIDLSTGQRKRLALISSIMENRPVLFLDEWAADQDPHFRKKFYEVILPQLKEDGFTIIAITHDDHYFDCADQLYKMEYGKLKEVKKETPIKELTT